MNSIVGWLCTINGIVCGVREWQIIWDLLYPWSTAISVWKRVFHALGTQLLNAMVAKLVIDVPLPFLDSHLPTPQTDRNTLSFTEVHLWSDRTFFPGRVVNSYKFRFLWSRKPWAVWGFLHFQPSPSAFVETSFGQHHSWQSRIISEGIALTSRSLPVSCQKGVTAISQTPALISSEVALEMWYWRLRLSRRCVERIVTRRWPIRIIIALAWKETRSRPDVLSWCGCYCIVEAGLPPAFFKESKNQDPDLCLIARSQPFCVPTLQKCSWWDFMRVPPRTLGNTYYQKRSLGPRSRMRLTSRRSAAEGALLSLAGGVQ